MFQIKKHWRKNAKDILVDRPDKAAIERYLFLVLGYMEMNNWEGACHATCALLHVFLKENGIDNVLCIGEAKSGEAFFDHSWIEIDGQIYDLAIAHSHDSRFSAPPVVNGKDVETLQPTHIQYGVKSGHPDHASTTAIKTIDLSTYMSAFPIQNGLWAVIENGFNKFGFKYDLNALKIKYQQASWTAK